MLPPKKTLKRREIPGTAHFLTFSCFRRLRLFDNDRIKDRFVEHLDRVVIDRDVQMFAWVIMPEHVHLVVATERTSMASFCNSLKRRFSIEVLKRWRELHAAILPRLRDREGKHHFWQAGGGYDRNVVGIEFLEKVVYSHRNPIERGLCATSIEWRWSSARRYERRPDAIGPEIAFDALPDAEGPLT